MSLHDATASRRRFIVGTSALAAGAFLVPGAAAYAAPAPPAGPDQAAAEEADSANAFARERADRQSPINIVTAQVATPPNVAALRIGYPTDVAMQVKYITKGACNARGAEETVEAFSIKPNGRVAIGNDSNPDNNFRLIQFHFHTNSEHQIDGRSFPIEQHFVHERISDGKLLVVGVFLTGGGSNPQDRVLARLPRECDPPFSLAGVNLRGMLPADLTNYRYGGSLTTEPFDEGVRWHVMRRPVQIQQDTINRFKALFPQGNSRPVQPRNGRTVTLTPGALGV